MSAPLVEGNGLLTGGSAEDRQKAIRKVRHKRMSLRAVERELGIHRATIEKYMDADSHPGRRTLPGLTASTSDTVAS